MTPSANRARFPLAAMVVTSVMLGACSSSDSGSDTPVDDQAGVAGNTGPIPESDGMAGADTETGAEAGGEAGGGAGDGDATTGEGLGESTGGSGGFADLSGQALNLGIVNLEQDQFDPDEGSVSGFFFRTNLPIPAEQLVSGFVPQMDTCSISRGEGVDADVSSLGDPDFEITSIGAGDALVLSSPGGTWLTLPRQEQFGFIVYGPENDTLPLPVPAGLVLDIPGAEFPAFSNVAVPNVTPLTGVVVEGGSTFRWNAGAGDPSVFIEIELFGLVAGSESIFVDCIARDDGEFTLPADIQAEIGQDHSLFPSADRVGLTVRQLNDSVLLVSHSSAGSP